MIGGSGPGVTRWPSRLLVVALVAMTSWVAGCRGPEPTAPTLSPLEIPRATPAPAMSEADIASLVETAAEAERALAAGDLERADELLGALARRDPGETYVPNRRALEASVADRLASARHVEAVILLERPHVALGEPIVAELSLVNLGSQPLRMAESRWIAGSGSTVRTTIHVEVRYSEFGYEGSVVEDRWSWIETVGESIDVVPGERARWKVRIDTLERNPSTVNFRRYEIRARLYPAELQIGPRARHPVVLFPPVTAAVFPRGYEGLIDRPLFRLSQAIEKDSAVHVPLAAALLEGEAIEEGLRVLRRVLERQDVHRPSEALRAAASMAARILLGVEVPLQPEACAKFLADRGTKR